MKPISVGDLVMIVRWPHGCKPPAARYLGKPFLVTNIEPSKPCCYCRWSPNEPLAYGAGEKIGGAPLSWLKRLDPDALKDDVPTRETEKA